MTFAPTYEELLTRNEKLENAVQDAMKELEKIEDLAHDDFLHGASGAAGYVASELHKMLEKAL